MPRQKTVSIRSGWTAFKTRGYDLQIEIKFNFEVFTPKARLFGD